MAKNRNISQHQIRKVNNVKTAEASIYWDRKDVKHTYGEYAVIYQLLSERYASIDATARQTRLGKTTVLIWVCWPDKGITG